jgi:hypothetical protein
LLDFPTSPATSCGPIGDAAGPDPANQNGRDLSPLLFKVLFKKYTPYEEMPEDKKIAKMLIEEYIWSEHNFIKYYFELQAVE